MLVGMDKEQLAKYIPDQFNWPQDFDWTPEKYQQFLDQYYRFNREATEDDPPENTWVLVKFVKAHSIVVDSDAEQSLLEGDGRYFDSSGRAVEGRVRRGEDGTVAFEVGMQNGGMASGLAMDVLKSSGAALAPAIFGPWMNVSGSVLATWWHRKPAARGAAKTSGPAKGAEEGEAHGSA